jgi:hypothetical protein
MEIAPDWLAIIDDEVHFRLHPRLLREVERGLSDLDVRQKAETIYKIDSKDLIKVLVSSLGIAPDCKGKGAIVIWTYCDEISLTDPILRTLLDIDGDFSQKVNQSLLRSPIAASIVQVHSYVISQISQQLITVIADYIARQLQPLSIAIITFITTVTWNDPLQAFLKKIKLSSEAKQIMTNITSHSLVFAFTTTFLVLVAWWIFYRSPFAKFLKSQSNRQQLISEILQKLSFSLQKLGKKLLQLLESEWAQRLAIAAMVVLGICWLALWKGIPLSPQWREAIIRLKSLLEPYLPVAIVSTRKKIQDFAWKIVSSNFGLIQSIFKFVFKQFKSKKQSKK